MSLKRILRPEKAVRGCSDMVLSNHTIFRRLVEYMESGNMPHVIRLVRAKADQEAMREARLFCAECKGGDLEMYMVHNAVWTAAGMEKGFLHLPCLERRLGRTLSADDFPRYVINKAILFAFERSKL